MRISDTRWGVTSALAAVATSFALLACGGDASVDDENVAAVVNGQAITTQQVDETVKNAPGALGTVDPPKFTKCIAETRKRAKTTDVTVTKDSALKACKQQLEAARQQALRTLILSQWVEQAADEQDVKIDEKKLKADVDTRMKALEANDEQSGTPRTEVEQQVRNEMILTALLKGDESDAKPSEKELRAWYEKNKSKLATPASRDVELLRFSKKSEAQSAANAIADGATFRSQAKKYDLPDIPVLTGLSRQGVPKELGGPLFNASSGELVGPVATGDNGWAVFRVKKKNPASEAPSFKVAKAQIEQMLLAEREQKQSSDASKKFQDEWRERTECAEDYKLDLCENVEQQTGSAGAMPPPGQATPPAQPTPAPKPPTTEGE